MTTLSCPVCGGSVKVPHVMSDTRIVCKKCHSPFHVNRQGVAVVGEPPDVEEELAEIRQKVQQKLERVPVGRIVAGLAALLVVGFAVYYLFGPAEALEPVAQEAAQALAAGDADTLTSLAAPDTAEDVARWYEEAHSRLDQQRAQWHQEEEVVEVHVAQEDREQGRATVGLSIRPGGGSTRDVTLADPAAATSTAAADAPFVVPTVWTLSRWGRWQLDGRETLARSGGTP